MLNIVVDTRKTVAETTEYDIYLSLINMQILEFQMPQVA
jgi:hypothetical protein